jgi:S1-C subfamily serine protease
MQSIEDNLQDLKKCTVAIRNSIGDNILGTGVIITDDGLIVTCYHVIEDQYYFEGVLLLLNTTI